MRRTSVQCSHRLCLFAIVFGVLLVSMLVAIPARSLAQAPPPPPSPPRVIIPAAPRNLQATPLDATSIRLDWSNADGNADGIRVTGPRGVIATLAGGSSSYVVTGLAPDTYFCANVEAFNVAGIAPSNDACATTLSDHPLSPPAAPQGSTATALSSTSIRLDWSGGSNGVDGYQIYDSATNTLVKTVDAGTTSFTLTGLQPGSDYCAVLFAYNAAGRSPPGDEVCATTQP